MPRRSLRVAVIGAGAAGLAAARELRREGHSPVVFERTDAVGGVWVYDAASSCLYASLRTNLPRESMGFLDFPFRAACEGDSDSRRFPGHEEVRRYLEDFARRFDLRGLVRLQTEVVRVTREAAGASESWRVRYLTRTKVEDESEAEEEEEVFDAVVVCNGHYGEPRFADIPGMDAWPGKVLHSNSYRVPEPFQSQVVVVIGCGPSGTDIARDIAGVAKEVHLANRSAPAATCERLPLPGYANLWLHSMVDRAEEDGSVVFQDGSRVEADVIMHCTGYKYSFSFLGEDSTISVDDNRVGPLYKHVFPPQLAPRLSFIGLPVKSNASIWGIPCNEGSTTHYNPNELTVTWGMKAGSDLWQILSSYHLHPQALTWIRQTAGVAILIGGAPIVMSRNVAPFPLFELQSNWVAGVLSGRIELPPEEEMTRDVTAFYTDLSARGWPRRHTHSMRSREFEYEDWLAGQCRRERVTEWRKELFAAALGMNTLGRMGSYRDERDAGDGGGRLDQLLAQANREFAQYPCPATPSP